MECYVSWIQTEQKFEVHGPVLYIQSNNMDMMLTRKFGISVHTRSWMPLPPTCIHFIGWMRR